MGGGTSGIGNDDTSSVLGLHQSHAYAILGAYELKDARGVTQARLLYLRNPWRFD